MEIILHVNWSWIVKTLVLNVHTLSSNTLWGKVEGTSDTAEDKFLPIFQVCNNTLYVSGQLVSHKLFSRARRTQFWQTQNYTSKIQKHTKLKKTRNTCFSWKRISRHFTCNLENFVHILAHIKSHSDEQAQVDSPKREGIFICNLLSGNDFPQNVFVNR